MNKYKKKVGLARNFKERQLDYFKGAEMVLRTILEEYSLIRDCDDSIKLSSLVFIIKQNKLKIREKIKELEDE